MSTSTSKLGLIKPEDPEFIDIDVINSNSDVTDNYMPYRTATSGDRPLDRYTGMPIYETDTKRCYLWDGEWKLFATAEDWKGAASQGFGVNWDNNDVGMGFVRYKLTARNTVALTGTAKRLVNPSPAPSTIFTLPVGYRPSNIHCFAVPMSPSQFAEIRVNPNGTVNAQTTVEPNQTISLSGIEAPIL